MKPEVKRSLTNGGQPRAAFFIFTEKDFSILEVEAND